MQNSKLLSLFISLQIDCFHTQWTVNICIAGLNRRAGYATDANQWNHEQHDETKQMKQMEQRKETVEVSLVHKIYDPFYTSDFSRVESNWNNR